VWQTCFDALMDAMLLGWAAASLCAKLMLAARVGCANLQ